jgi:hypothetical protein
VEKTRAKMARRERRVRKGERNIVNVLVVLIDCTANADTKDHWIRVSREDRLDDSSSRDDGTVLHMLSQPLPLFAVPHHSSVSQEARSTAPNYFHIGSSMLDSRSPRFRVELPRIVHTFSGDASRVPGWKFAGCHMKR